MFYMKIYLVFLTGLLLLGSCSSSDSEGDVVNDQTTNDTIPIDANTDFVDVHAEFDSKKNGFTEKVHIELLRELEICVEEDQDSTVFAACSPENFKITPISKSGKGVKDAFALQIKAGIVLKDEQVPLQDRSVLIFERENGQLVNVNGVIGNLISMRPGKGEFNDLIIGIYNPEEDVFFDCYFTWNGEKYSFESVLALSLDGKKYSPIKESEKESVSKEVYTALMDAKLIY